MSRLSDYSKFDHIDSDSDESQNGKEDSKTTFSGSEGMKKGSMTPIDSDIQKTLLAQSYTSSERSTTKQGSEIDRYVYEYEGRKIYEWDQNLEEVNLYIEAPPRARAADFDIQIKTKQLSIGLKGSDKRFIDEATFSKVDTSESSWYLDSGVLYIVLIKAHRGETWEAALMGRHYDGKNGSDGLVDPITREKMKEKLMLERFQEENPGFDFRDATFNGEAPNPRSFMGGIGYK